MNHKSAILIVAIAVMLGAGAFFAHESKARQGLYRIGDRGPAGGWVFYDKGNSSGGWRYLEAAPVDQSDGARWGWDCYGLSIPGARGTAIGAGKSNTRAILKKCATDGTAAALCASYRGRGKSDWFLPSGDELNAMYVNLHKAGIGGFANYYYWSSSESHAYYAHFQSFIDGSRYFFNKVDIIRVRAIRAFQ
jgi:hypothetical protein